MNQDWRKGIHTFPGTSRKERTARALLPEHLRIDARGISDDLTMACNIAQFIRYFNARNEADGNWAAFLTDSPVVFLALMLDNRPDTWDLEVRSMIQRFYAGQNRRATCLQLTGKVLKMAALLDEWYRGAVRSRHWHSDNPAGDYLRLAVAQDQHRLRTQLGRFRAMLKELSLKQELDRHAFREMLEQLEAFDSAWKLEEGTFGTASPSESALLETIVEESRILFQAIYALMTAVAQKAPVWFRDMLVHSGDNAPHVGLLLAFLELFQHARDQMNDLPRRHLQHYYFDVLRQQRKPPAPDWTTVCFLLAEHVNEWLLPSGTLLSAGLNEQGQPSRYALEQDMLLTKGRIAGLKTIFVDRNPMLKVGSSYRLVSGIYAAPEADSSDGDGKPFGAGESSWPVFGAPQLDRPHKERQMIDARIGFVLAAPVLTLREGDREIHLQFAFTAASLSMLLDLIDDIAGNTGQDRSETGAQLFSSALLVDASTASGWHRIDKWKIDSPDQWLTNGRVTLSLYLYGDDPAIEDNIPAVLGEDFQTPWPLLRILLNPDHNQYLHSFVQALELESIRIDIQVKQLKSLTLINELGQLDGTAPFMPFGPVPNRNSYLLIGSAELFRKRLTDLSLHIQWNNLPETEGGFAAHYRGYPGAIDNSSFQVQLSALTNTSFRPLDPALRQSFPLFQAEGPDTPPGERTTFDAIQFDLLQIQPDYQLLQLAEYSHNTRSGYFKLQLSQPARAFGHTEYPRLFAAAVVAQAQGNGLLNIGGKPQDIALPREPFTPVVNRLTVDYKASATLSMRPLESDANDLPANEKVICLHPFGHQEIFSGGKVTDRFLFPRYEADGMLHIGLEDVQPLRPVSIFFKVRESKKKAGKNSLSVQWSYLSGNRWENLPEEHLLSDTTRQFTTTGIVKILIPEGADIEGNTLMPAGMLWLRAAAKGNLGVVGRILGVRLNAAEVRWVDNGDARHYDAGRPLTPIIDLAQPIAAVSGVEQLTPYEGGRPGEQETEFYVRTSERLRHKNRAQTLWDYERLVLDAFPNLRRVKCIGWMEYPLLKPGQVKVVAIPNAPSDELQPMLGYHELERIREFLQDKISPFVQIEVINPVYERIKLSGLLRLKKGLEPEQGRYLQQLHQDFKAFLCPWLQDGAIVMGGSIQKNDVLSFLNGRPYIRNFTRFSLTQIFESEDEYYSLEDTAAGQQDKETLGASRPWSILIPVEQHNLGFIGTDEHMLPEPSAIESMRLGTDFIVVDSETPPEPPQGLREHEPGTSGGDTDDFYFLPKK